VPRATLSCISLLLASDRSQVLVQVWDGSPDPPVQASTDENAEGGRGLLLVVALCADWGWHLPAGGSKGKWVSGDALDGHRNVALPGHVRA
jgi:hypothetical protein